MKKLALFLGLTAGMLLNLGCKKNSFEPGPYEGVAICASPTFAFINPLTVNDSQTPAAVSLQANPYNVTIKAKMNERVSWTVTIYGTISNATKTFTGISDSVNVKWWGNPDGGEAGGDKFFLTAGEPVTVTITPACAESQTVNLTLTKGSLFDKFGSVECNFDGIGSVYAYPNPAKPMVLNKDTVSYVPASPQGGNCHIFYCPEHYSGWYIGGIGQAVDLSTVFGSSLASNNTWVNLYINGTSGTTLTLDIVEKVGTTSYHFKQNIIPYWNGWKMVSYRLSDLNIGNPLKIASTDVSAGPGVFDGETKAFVDFIIYTKGKPFLGSN